MLSRNERRLDPFGPDKKDRARIAPGSWSVSLALNLSDKRGNARKTNCDTALSPATKNRSTAYL